MTHFLHRFETSEINLIIQRFPSNVLLIVLWRRYFENNSVIWPHKQNHDVQFKNSWLSHKMYHLGQEVLLV